jgi:uncharacterized protein (TIGR02118 family)
MPKRHSTPRYDGGVTQAKIFEVPLSNVPVQRLGVGNNAPREGTMIRVTVMYPNTPGSNFNWAYYLNTHIPLALRKLGSAVKGTAVDQGLAGLESGSPPPYVAVAQFLFESVDALQQAFAPHADELLGDIPNYTNIQPRFQISEIKVSSTEAALHT